MEAVSFVPYTPESELKRRLQQVDDELSELMRRPKIRFVEGGGRRVDTEVGLPNPWAAETECDRDGCLHCQGKAIIAAGKEL